MLFLKQPLILPFLCHKSATSSPIDSCKVSNSDFKPDVENHVKIEIIEPTAPPQHPHKLCRIFLGHPAYANYRKFIKTLLVPSNLVVLRGNLLPTNCLKKLFYV